MGAYFEWQHFEWCDKCKRYYTPGEQHICAPPIQDKLKWRKKLERWLGDYEIQDGEDGRG